MKTNTPTLPEAITQYLDATNRFDADSAAACFTPEATVQDDGKTYTGAEEIRQWVAQASEADTDALSTYFFIRIWAAHFTLANYAILGSTLGPGNYRRNKVRKTD